MSNIPKHRTAAVGGRSDRQRRRRTSISDQLPPLFLYRSLVVVAATEKKDEDKNVRVVGTESKTKKKSSSPTEVSKHPQHEHYPNHSIDGDGDDDDEYPCEAGPSLTTKPKMIHEAWKEKIHETWKNMVHLIDEQKKKNPILIKSITAFLVHGFGDICGQLIEHTRGMSSSTAPVVGFFFFEWPRAARFAWFGFFSAPLINQYFRYLDTWFPLPINATKPSFSRTTWIKVFIDQIILAPILITGMISLLSLMKLQGLDGMKADLADELIRCLIANWMIWLPSSIVNFAYVEPAMRVLFVNATFFVWTVILSFLLDDR